MWAVCCAGVCMSVCVVVFVVCLCVGFLCATHFFVRCLFVQ